MKKIICIIMTAIMAVGMTACGSNKEKSNSTTITQQSEDKGNKEEVQSDTGDSKSEVGTTEYKKSGYVFYIPDKEHIFRYGDRYTDTEVISYPIDNIQCKYKIIVGNHRDVVDFNSWDTVVDDIYETMRYEVESSGWYRMNSQSVDERKNVTSAEEIESLVVKGVLTCKDGGDEIMAVDNGTRHYSACYYVDSEGKARFCIAINWCGDKQYDAVVDEAIENIAENLQVDVD